MKRIYLIDCPGIVPPSSNDTEQDLLLRGVVRVENVQNPEQYVAGVLGRCKQHHVERTYNVRGWNNATEFLEAMARNSGRLLKGGEADLDGVAKMVINDFLRGKIPWYTPPPAAEGDEGKGLEGREGRLGEMSKKRKRADDVESTGVQNEADAGTESAPDEEDEEGFDGFDDDEAVPSDDESDEESDAEGGAELPQEVLNLGEGDETDESSEAEDDELPQKAETILKGETESDSRGRQQAPAKPAKRRRKI